MYLNLSMKLLHFSALFDRPLNHPTLFSSQGTENQTPWRIRVVFSSLPLNSVMHTAFIFM